MKYNNESTMIEHVEVKDFTVFDELKTENAKKQKKELDAISGFGDWRRLFPSLIRRLLVRNKGLGF